MKLSRYCWVLALLGCMPSHTPAPSATSRSSETQEPGGAAESSKGAVPAATVGAGEVASESKLDPAILGLRDIQYSLEAREEYGGPDLQSDQAYGVIVEIGFQGTVVIVAGFRDGTSRLIMGKGGGILGYKEDFPAESREAAKFLVGMAQPLLSGVPLEQVRSLPRQGNVRFAILTGSGVHATEKPVASLADQKSDLAPLWGATNRLLGVLLEFMQQRQPK